MRRLSKFIIGALLILTFIRCDSQVDKLTLTLQVKDINNKLPSGADDWFVVNFLCSIKNNTDETIFFVNPEAYKIFPQPWIICIDGVDSNLWSGDPTCAPSFSEEDIITLRPKETINRTFDWHTFVPNFSKTPGDYSAKIKYEYIGRDTWTMGADKKSLTDLKTSYSNSVKFKIIQ
jgi:hypothetical protein